MSRRGIWHEEYWLLLVQLYLKKPQGVKPLYSKGMVDLALDLHIAPDYLQRKMQMLDNPASPRLRRMLDSYAANPSKLLRKVKTVRQMKGFGNAEEFYENVKVNESWQRWWRPVTALPDFADLTPVMIVLILDLYYRLIPDTMVRETPEVVELARLIGIKADVVVEVLEIFRSVDPALPDEGIMLHPLLNPCMQVWKQLDNGSQKRVTELADQLRNYFE